MKLSTTKITAGMLLAVSAMLSTACTDTWDEHYDSSASGTSLWEAVSANSDLSNFKHVIEGCGYDKNLAGSQTYTVFAPNNSTLSSTQADSLVTEYNKQKNAGVKDAENTVIKQFIQNHISPFSQTVSSLTNKQIAMMNGKYQTLTESTISNLPLLSKNEMHSNGVLYTIGNKISYFPNLYEYLGLDKDVDSVYNFINSYSIYALDANKSVAGSIVNGETEYLDSVMIQSNDIINTLGEINSEDSTFIMVVPTNSEWERMTKEYSTYFNFAKTVNKRDSMQYAATRLAILRGTVFSRSINSDASLQDSAVSTNANSYETRKLLNQDPYYIYSKPYENIFANTEHVTCSNGTLMKKSNWDIDIHKTFAQTIRVEAEDLDYQDTIIDAENPLTTRTISSSSRFYDKVSGNSYAEIIPENSNVNPSVVYAVPNILSNLAYDVYVVFAPAIANDTLASEEDRLPCKFTVNLTYKNADGGNGTKLNFTTYKTTADEMNEVKVYSNLKIPICSLGMKQVKLTVKSNVKSTETSKFSRKMRIDCILFKPHEN